jgi:hypothetical protein
LDGYPSSYSSKPAKPKNFVDACKKLEQRTAAPHSFRILIPRALPALYDVRNNRGVGHVGGDVDPNHMDATLVLGMANWVLAELVRVFHSLSIPEAQRVVDSLAERRIPIVWVGGTTKRVLNTKLKIPDQMIVLIASEPGAVSVDALFDWLDYDDRAYFIRTLRRFHKVRLINLSNDEKTLQLLPPGSVTASKIIQGRK